jgi:hypothetical protein
MHDFLLHHSFSLIACSGNSPKNIPTWTVTVFWYCFCGMCIPGVYCLFGAVQIVIDSCCATFAEVQKRGKDFWSEFELYAADLLVGVVVDIALVGLLAPYARFGKPSTSRGLLGRVQQACAALPSRFVAYWHCEVFHFISSS